MLDETIDQQTELKKLQLENQQIQQQLALLLEEQSQTNVRLGQREQELQQTQQALHQKTQELEILFMRPSRQGNTSSTTALQHIAEHLPGMLYQQRQQSDGTFAYVYVSTGCTELYQLSAEQIYQDTQAIWQLIHPDDRAQLEPSMRHAAKHLIEWEYEHRLLLPEGQIKWLKGMAKPCQEADGSIVWDGYVCDISEYKAAEVALMGSEEQFRRLVENSQDVIWTTNLDGKVTYLSPRFQEMFGYPISAWMGRAFTALVHPVDLSYVVQTLRQVAKSGRSEVGIEFRYCNKDQQWSWASMSVAPIKTPQGKVHGFQGIWRDISDRKHAEHQLQDQARRDALLNRLTVQIRKTLNFDVILQTTLNEIQQLFDIDRCGFVTYIKEGDHAYWQLVQEARRPGIAVMPNQFAISDSKLSQRLQALQHVEVVDASIEPDPETQQMFQELGVRSMLAIPEQLSDEILCVLTCSYLAEPRDWTNEEVELLQTVTAQLAIALKQADLYSQSQQKAKELEVALQELKRTQVQMVQSEKMSSLGQMVAGIAHEINNPTNFIYANLEYTEQYANEAFQLIQLYQKHYPDPHPEIAHHMKAMDLEFLQSDLQKLCHSMQVGADRIREIVNSLRNFSRLDESEFKSANLHEGLDNTLMIVQSRLKGEKKRPEIRLVKEYAELPLVDCYPGDLNQVFLNLLNNAIDALEARFPNHETVQIVGFAPAILVKTILNEPELGWVTVQITDNGMGVPESIQNRIFDPFFTTKDVGKGTGLGLSVSYQTITEQHGGKLLCFSQVGQGTVFVIQIPVKNYDRKRASINGEMNSSDPSLGYSR
jgi:two-component system, NtrC family, sensor kinase